MDVLLGGCWEVPHQWPCIDGQPRSLGSEGRTPGHLPSMCRVCRVPSPRIMSSVGLFLFLFFHKKLIPKLEFLDLSHNGVLVVDNLQVINVFGDRHHLQPSYGPLRVQKADAVLGVRPYPGVFSHSHLKGIWMSLRFVGAGAAVIPLGSQRHSE